jgi:aspartate aminotransferase
MKVSQLAEHIIGSEIIKLAGEVNEKIKQGQPIHNFTIGDFDPSIFPIPDELKSAIIAAYQHNETNYPAGDGMLELRQAVSYLLKNRAGLDYKTDEILIAGGARPVIYSIFRALVDPGDHVFFATPSWNNNHYTYLNGGVPVMMEATPEQNFMPSAADIAPHVSKLSLITLCSPQNPTGTVFTKEGLTEICDLVLAENKRRGKDAKPVYVMYDQIYWALTYGEVKHYDPVTLRPDMRDYTIFVDGISKSLAATGVRVGWTMGPKFIVDKMKAILSHVGAWAPKAEQLATATYLNNLTQYDAFIEVQKEKIQTRLVRLYEGMKQLKTEGYQVDVVTPQAAIYLTVKFALHGKTRSNGEVLESTRDVTRFLLEEANLAIVPFYAFGASENSAWYRLSVGTCKLEAIDQVFAQLRKALSSLR